MLRIFTNPRTAGNGRFIAALLLGCAPGALLANPQDGVVSSGSATISSQGNLLEIRQSTDRAVIDWRGFDIAPHETTRFIQPGSSSWTLNRVNAATPSQIQGRIEANGNIAILNPNGVVFHAGSRVDAAGVIATSADINNADFMAGRMDFNITGNPNAVVENHGTITAAEAGLVGLVAPNVHNSGVIEARLGRVALAAGDSFTLDLAGDGLISVALNQDMATRIEHTGQILADGGTVRLTAAAGRGVVDSLIHVSGDIQAHAVQDLSGSIEIFAEGSNAVNNNEATEKALRSGASIVSVSGKLDASGKGVNEKGGNIRVLGDQVGILAGGVLDASGSHGGGNINVGGDYQGKGIIPAARFSYVDANASIQANAMEQGDGGRVILWSDGDTSFSGTIEAKGGLYGGNGGFVETSGHHVLAFSGFVDVTAPMGQTGTLLLDPTNLTISSGANSNITWTGSQYNGTSATSVLNVTTLQTQLASANVLVTTASAFGSTGNLTVSNAITWSSGNSLTLFADNDITVNANITYTGAANTSLTLRANNDVILSSSADIAATGAGAMDVVFNADRDASNAGAVRLNTGTSITSNGGKIVLGGGSGDPESSGYAVGNATNQRGVYLTDATLSSGAGNITMRGMGYSAVGATGSGVNLEGVGGSVLQTTSGNIYIWGTGSGVSTNSDLFGVDLRDVNITTISGNLDVIGYGGGAGAASLNHGIYMDGSQGIAISTASGNISFTGVGGNGTGGSNHGVRFNSGGTISVSGSGNITIEGTRGSTSGDGIKTLTSDTTLGSGTMTGTVKLIADTVSIDQLAIQTLGDVILRPKTAGTTVGILTTANTLDITSTWLGKVTYGGTLWLGGDSTWNDSGNTRIAGTRAFNGNVTFMSGEDLSVTTGTLSKSAGAANADWNYIADNDITFSGSSDITPSVGYSIDITLWSDYDNSGLGGISLGSGTVIASNGGNITLGGGTNPLTDDAMGNASSSGILLNNATLSGGAGNVSLRGTGGSGAFDSYLNGIYLQGGASITSTSGGISLVGASGTAVDLNSGIYVTDAGTDITTQTGAITLTGTSSALSTGQYNTGVSIDNGAVVESTGAGASAITITGTGGGGSDSGRGVGVYWGSAITSVSANINVTATGGTAAGGSNHGLNINEGGIIRSTGSGDVTLTGIAGSGAASYGMYFSNGSNIIGDAAATGDIYLNTNSISYADATITTTSDTFIRQYTAANTIGVGAGAGTLSITDAMLATVSTGTLSIGQANAGLVTIDSAFAYDDATSFISDTGITVSSALATAAASDGSFTFTGPTTVNANINTSNSSAAAGTITFGNYSHTLAADLTTDDSNITINGATTLSGAVGVTRTINAGTGMLTTAASGSISAGNRYLSLVANDMVLAGALSGTGTLTITSGSDATVMNIANDAPAGGLNISDAELALFADGFSYVAFGDGGANSSDVINVGTFSTLDAAFFWNRGAINVLGALSGNNNTIGFYGHDLNIDTLAGSVSTTGLVVFTRTGAAGVMGVGTAANNTGYYLTDAELARIADSAKLHFGGYSVAGSTVDVNTAHQFGDEVWFGFENTTWVPGLNVAVNGALSTAAGSDGRFVFAGPTVFNADVDTSNSLAGTGTIVLNNWTHTLGADLITDDSNITINGATTVLGAAGVTRTINAGSGILTTAATGTLTAATANLSLIADSVALGSSVTATAGDLVLRPYTAARAVNLGTAAGATNFALDDTELGYLSAGGTLWLGGSGTWNDSGNTTINTTRAFNGNVTFMSGGDLSVNTGTLSKSAGAANADWNYIADDDITFSGSSDIAPSVGYSIDITLRSDHDNSGLGSISLGGGTVIASNDGNITIVTGDSFTNSGTIDPGATGRWLVYGTTIAKTNLGGNAFDFRRFDCTYGGACPAFPATGNGLLLTAPTVTLTVTAADASSTYGDNHSLVIGGYSITGYLAGEDATTADLTGAASITTAATATSNVGSYSIVAALGTLANTAGYDFTFVDGTLTVNKASLTAVVHNKSRAFGVANPAVDSSDVTWTGFVNGEDHTVLDSVTLGYEATATAAAPLASTHDIDITAFSDGNYDLSSYTAGVLLIGKKQITAVVSDLSRQYGDANPSYGLGDITFIGLEGADTNAVIDGFTFNIAGTATAAANAGTTHNVTIAGFTDDFYDLTAITDGTLTITKKDIIATVNNQSRAYGSANPTVTLADVVFVGLQNGETTSVFDAASLTYAPTATATANAGTAHAISLTGFSDNNYNLAVMNAGSLTISKASLTASVQNKSRQYGASNPALALTDASFTGFVNGQNAAVLDSIGFSYAASAVPGAAVGSTHAINLSLLDNNYQLSSFTPGALTITAVPGSGGVIGGGDRTPSIDLGGLAKPMAFPMGQTGYRLAEGMEASYARRIEASEIIAPQQAAFYASPVDAPYFFDPFDTMTGGRIVTIAPPIVSQYQTGSDL